ncbi:MAG: signal peptidase II [Chthoniobacterales bacterium]
MIRLLLLITLPLYVLDQLTKWLVLRNISTNEFVEVIPNIFWLVQVHNTGAAFGMMKDNNAFFIGLSLVALVAMVIFWKRGAFADRWVSIGAALLVSGILGNLTDRLIHGHVIDFLMFDLHVPFASPWPSFNVADSCISVAAVIFVVRSIFEPKREVSAK